MVIVLVIVACLLLAFADIIYVFVVYGRQENYKLYLRPTTWHLEIECFFKSCKMEDNFKMKRKVKIMLGWAYFWGIQLSNDKSRYDRKLKIGQWVNFILKMVYYWKCALVKEFLSLEHIFRVDIEDNWMKAPSVEETARFIEHYKKTNKQWISENCKMSTTFIQIYLFNCNEINDQFNNKVSIFASL